MSSVWEWEDFRWCCRCPWKWPSIFLKNVKYSWQRVTKGYCDKDLWNIDFWFMKIMPRMLQQFKETKHGSPSILGENDTDTDGMVKNDTCHEAWDKILDEMIFLFREMNEETCSRKNIYEEEHDRVHNEFEKKYGMFGEKLESEASQKSENRRIHFPGELQEYKEIEEKYYDYEKELDSYREACKDKAFALFSKWFYALWD